MKRKISLKEKVKNKNEILGDVLRFLGENSWQLCLFLLIRKKF